MASGETGKSEGYMKIAVFGINYYPEVTGIGLYTTEMCEYLASKGHDVGVFTAFPYYPFGHDFSAWYKEKGIRRRCLFSDDHALGVRITRCNLYKPAQPNVLRRIIHETSFVASIFMRTLFDRRKYDVVICISPPLILGFAARMFARAKKAFLILHVQDMQPDAAIELGMIKNRVLISLLLWLEKHVYEKSDYVMTISEAMRNKIVEKGLAAGKVGLLFNWVNPSNIIPLDRRNSFSNRHGLNDKFVVLHAGNMGEKQDMHIIVEAANAMRGDPSVVFLLVGGGVKKAYTERYVKRHGLSNVLFLGVQPKGALNEMLSSCDAAVVAQRHGVRDCVMPSKIFGPACAEKPLIIASHDDCEVAKLARAHNFGIVIPPADAAALVAAIYHLKENSHLASELGRNGRHFMIRDRQLENILGRFETDLISKHAFGEV